MPQLDGFLNVAKPSGCTSRDVVNRVQRLVKPAKTGHAGTLDPLAEGVLVVAVGQATRLIENVQAGAKHYRGQFRLGCRSNTEDVEGEIETLDDPPVPTETQLRSACAALEGEIEQTPPAYSALKVDGKRAYRLARQGVDVRLKPRRVRVDQCRLVHYDYPSFTLEIVCGGGTYVRSLGRDLAASCGSAAVMTALTRTAVGGFSLDDAVTPEQLDADGVSPFLLPLQKAVPEYPQVQLSEDEWVRLHNGLRTPNRFELAQGAIAAAVNDRNRLMSLVESCGDELKPIRNFPLAD